MEYTEKEISENKLIFFPIIFSSARIVKIKNFSSPILEAYLFHYILNDPKKVFKLAREKCSETFISFCVAVGRHTLPLLPPRETLFNEDCAENRTKQRSELLHLQLSKG